MDTIIGAGIALLGVVVTLLFQAWSEKRRLAAEERRDAINRYFEQRREALLGFLQEVERLVGARQVEEQYGRYLEGPPLADMDDATERLYDALVRVQIYGTEETHESASQLADSVSDFINGRVEHAQVHTRLQRYLRFVRVDLGVDRNPWG